MPYILIGMTGVVDTKALAEAIELARSDPGLGRSARVRELFDYLAACSLDGRSPKETEVAIEVFGRLADFDPTRDAIARVYVHKLRQRLEAMSGIGLTIPRGEYRLVLQDEATPEPVALSRRQVGILAALAGMLFAAIALWFALPSRSPSEAVRAKVWSTLIGNGRPTIVALGDYFIFAEMGGSGGGARLVREYTVNSPADLDRYRRDNPARAANYQNLDLHYLPVGTGDVLASLAPVLVSTQATKVLPVSQVTPAMLRDNNIIYIGYLSGLGLLRDPAFAGSRYEIGETYDAIIDTVSNERFDSGGGSPGRGAAMYPDYGYLSTFAGPTGNRIVIIAGTRDAALASMSQTAMKPNVLDQLAGRSGKSLASEALFGIKSLKDVSIDSRLIRVSPMQQGKIWEDAGGREKVFPPG